MSRDEPARAADASAGRRTGRPVDHSTDAVILASTLDLLAERDYERVTLDEVAARTGRAKTTLYRRWATKEDLVLAAVRTAGQPPEAADPPDTGSLRTDLLAVVDSPWLGGPDRRMAVFAGLASSMRHSDRLAEVVRAEIAQPYVAVYRRLMERAVERGEVASEAAGRIPVLAEVIPSMSTDRVSAGGEPVDREFYRRLVDDVLLAALGLTER